MWILLLSRSSHVKSERVMLFKTDSPVRFDFNADTTILLSSVEPVIDKTRSSSPKRFRNWSLWDFRWNSQLKEANYFHCQNENQRCYFYPIFFKLPAIFYKAGKNIRYSKLFLLCDQKAKKVKATKTYVVS